MECLVSCELGIQTMITGRVLTNTHPTESQDETIDTYWDVYQGLSPENLVWQISLVQEIKNGKKKKKKPNAQLLC